MSIRAEVDYKIRGHIENIALLQALMGDDEPVEGADDLTDEDIVPFLTQWIGGIQDGLLHLADYVDQLASD